MSANHWPAAAPFDPATGLLPAPLEALWSRTEDSGHLLILTSGTSAWREGWAARTAISLATARAAQGVQVLLADLGLESPTLHLELGEENVEGVADIFQFGASLRRVARVVPGHGILFLPTGAYIPDPAELLADPMWEQLLAQLDEEQTCFLASLPVDTPGAERLARRFDKVVVLIEQAEGDAARVIAGDPERDFELVLYPPVEAEPVPAAETGVELAAERELAREEEAPLHEPPPMPRAPRRRRGVSPVLWLLLLVAVAVGGWTMLEERSLLPEWARLPERLAPEQEAAPEPEEATAAKAATPVMAEPVESPLPFSVAVEAHQDYATAEERVLALRRSQPAISFYLSPIVEQGVIYHRILAGPIADTTAAWKLMERLVAARQKTDLDAWSIRPTVWAFQLGDFKSKVDAVERMEELRTQQIPTYLVEVEYTAGPPRFRIYIGAFEGPAPAEILATRLKGAGLDLPLVRRYGKPIQ